MTTVLVTGAAGDIGTAIAEVLVQRAYALCSPTIRTQPTRSANCVDGSTPHA